MSEDSNYNFSHTAENTAKYRISTNSHERGYFSSSSLRVLNKCAAGSRLNYTRGGSSAIRTCCIEPARGQRAAARQGWQPLDSAPNKCWRKQAHQLAAPGAHWLINGRAISRESWRACGYCQPRLAPAAPARSPTRCISETRALPDSKSQREMILLIQNQFSAP